VNISPAADSLKSSPLFTYKGLPMDLAAIHLRCAKRNIDAWLFYDHPIAILSLTACSGYRRI